MIEKYSGLPLNLDGKTGEIRFHDGLLCDSISQKKLREMDGLFQNQEGMDGDALVYRAYRNIRFAEDEAMFTKWDFRYDITVVFPGNVNGEFYKTSGHFHGYPSMAQYPFPEVYEVVQGEIVFVLQRNPDFNNSDGGKISQIQAVHVKAGQAIIVPPHCGHGSINPTDGVSIFSNIAVDSCPLDYEPIKAHRGLSVYIVKGNHRGKNFLAVPNKNYSNLPAIEIAEPVENPELGIEFGVPCYRNFIEHPNRYDFLLHPDSYIEAIDQMTKIV